MSGDGLCNGINAASEGEGDAYDVEGCDEGEGDGTGDGSDEGCSMSGDGLGFGITASGEGEGMGPLWTSPQVVTATLCHQRDANVSVLSVE